LALDGSAAGRSHLTGGIEMVASRLRVAMLGGLVAGTVLLTVLVTSGQAASPSICVKSPSPCLTISVVPSYVAVGSDGVALAKFTNQGTATATQTVVAVTPPPGTSPVLPILSTPAATCSGSPVVSCSFGSVPGGSTVKVVVRFHGDTASPRDGDGNPIAGAAHAKVSFDEGNVNKNSPSNDTVFVDSNSVAVVDVGSNTELNGKCADPVSTDSLSASTAIQLIKVSYPSAKASLGLPCTPVDVGIDLQHPVAGSGNKITFVALPSLSGDGLGTVIIDLPTLPQGSNLSKFVLREIPGYPGTIGSPAGWPQVIDCVAGAPAGGADSCILSRAKYGSKGIELTLKVVGTNVDPAYWG
jgi:hypothetical protein